MIPLAPDFCLAGESMVTMIRALAGEPGIPSGFPILLDRNMAIIEPAFVWLLEHATLRGRRHATETVRTYGEHLYDWFDTLDQSELSWVSRGDLDEKARQSR